MVSSTNKEPQNILRSPYAVAQGFSLNKNMNQSIMNTAVVDRDYDGLHYEYSRGRT